MNTAHKNGSTQTGLVAALVVFTAGAAAADAQGWDGPGWYISDGTPSAPQVLPAYILFNGPHDRQGDCTEVYDRLYSPVGMCRYLATKPGNVRG